MKERRDDERKSRRRSLPLHANRMQRNQEKRNNDQHRSTRHGSSEVIGSKGPCLHKRRGSQLAEEPSRPHRNNGQLPRDLPNATTTHFKLYEVLLEISIPTTLMDENYRINSTTVLNEWLNTVQHQDSEAGLVPWNNSNLTEILRKMTPQATVWRNYVHGYDANYEGGRPHEWKITLALASSTDMEDIRTELNQWEDGPQWRLATTEERFRNGALDSIFLNEPPRAMDEHSRNGAPGPIILNEPLQDEGPPADDSSSEASSVASFWV